MTSRYSEKTRLHISVSVVLKYRTQGAQRVRRSRHYTQQLLTSQETHFREYSVFGESVGCA